MKSAFIKDIFREIGKTKSRFFSIFAIIALGAGFFAGLKGTCPDMLVTQDNYFKNSNLMDIKIVSNYGFDENDVTAIEETGEIRDIWATYSKDVFVENDNNSIIIAKLMSFPEKGMNEVILVDGRLPKNPDECVVERHSQMEVTYEIGETVSVYTTDPDDPIGDSLERNEWEVVGIVMSPQYIAYNRGNATIGDGGADTYIMVPEENFTIKAYTEIYLTLDSTKELSAFDEKYTAEVEKASENFEIIAEKRAPERLDEIKEEAYAEINDAKKEIADAEKELADAEAELAEAEAELADGRKKLDDGWAEYYKGVKDYNDGIKQFEEEIAKAERELEEGEAEISEGWDQYYEGLEQYEAGLAEFEAGLAQSGMSVGTLYSMRDYLQKTIDAMSRLPGMEWMIAQLESQLSQINAAISGYEQLLAAEKELESAKRRLQNGASEIERGKKELESAKISGKEELEKGKKELDNAYMELKDAEEELAEGIEEYNEGLAEFEEAKAEAETEIADAKREIADAEKELEELRDPKWYIFTRDDNPGYSSYESDVYIIESVGKVFPIFFFLVAMLVCLTTMTRMVEEQRTQIGTMKALGYGKGMILMKYLVYSAFASISGAVFGIAVCSFVFPLIIYYAYGMRYIIPPLEIVPMPGMWAVIILVCVLCTTLAVAMAGYAELRESPAGLMRPKAPKAGKRVLLEKIPFIWKRLNFTKKVTVRNLFRYKKRIFMTILGIAGCAALTLTGFGILSSISIVFEKQYSEIFNYDLIVSLDSDSEEEKIVEVFDELSGNGIVEEELSAYMMSASYNGIQNLTLVAAEDPELLEEMICFRDPETEEIHELSEDGIIVTERFAEKFELSPGDEFTFYCDDAELTARIDGIAENYAMHFIYMSGECYENLTGEEPEINSVFAIMSATDGETQEELANTLMEYDGVLALTFSKDSMESFKSVVENLNYVVILIIVCAAALAFVVLYNLTNINITERIREIATIKVLGFYDKEVSSYVFRENIILSILGAGTGLLLGKGLHSFVMSAIQTDDVMFGRFIPLWAYASAFAMTIFFAFAVNWIMYFRLKKVSMVESLKSVE
ncbi:MAG: FtsX-like permease family protein [Ruminococcaceae bacterium]|nr:FtsX-like permease family protein [Oscillospiraceae bacterium]